MHLAAQPVKPEVSPTRSFVLVSEPRKFPTPTIDRDRTVSRRFWTQLACHFNGRTAQPLGPSPAPGCDEPTSRCQTSVDMSSWEGSACYPWSTFLSFERCPFHTETPDHYALVFLPDRLVVSPSQAPLCHYTLPTVTNRREGTFRSLRYTFWGDHPSQTTHQTVSPQQRVRTQIIKGAVFQQRFHKHWRAASEASGLSYTSITQIQCCYSKGSRGLFVLIMGNRYLHRYYNFTEPRLRHKGPDHYTIRAGRNLPDKEFATLRDRYSYGCRLLGGFNSMLRFAMTSPL